MLNVGSCHVALVESTGTSVGQADGFLCGTKGGKGHVTSCYLLLPVSSTVTPIRTHRKKLLPNMQVKKKSSRKAVALGELLPTAQSTIPSAQCPAFQ